jgi:hypothetical protein
MIEAAYGGVMPALFGSPQSLMRYSLPSSCIPLTYSLPIKDIQIYNQKKYPTCTAAASTTLLELSYAAIGEVLPSPSVAFTYLAGEELVSQKKNISIETQIKGGLPLAASVEAICLKGSVPRSDVPFPDDPVALSAWMLSTGKTIDDISREKAFLITDYRPLRLFPSEDSLKGALLSRKAVAFSFRIGALTDTWMRDPSLQRITGFRLPLSESGPRLATHACIIIGYDDNISSFRIRNSFGSMWGDNGDFWISYSTMILPFFSGAEFYTLG